MVANKIAAKCKDSKIPSIPISIKTNINLISYNPK